MESKFVYEEDYVIQAECVNCGSVHFEEVLECEDCGSELVMNETSHEGMECIACTKIFDMWTNCYVKEDEYLCEECYASKGEKND